MNLGFLIDNRKCIGCHACTVACKSEHDLPIGVNRTWVKYVEKGEFPETRRLFSVLRCNHCAEAPCVEICPTSALHYLENGIVDFDTRRCIACRSCMQACPYDALYINPEEHVAEKCNFCAHRIERGLEPACVVICPEKAIVFGDLEDEGSEIRQLLSSEPVTVRKPEKGTLPKLYYIEGDRASLDPSLTEASGHYVFSEQAGGVGHFSQDQLVQIALGESTGSGRHRGQVAETLASGDPRRVYDAPGKGVLWGWQVAGYIWTKAIASGLFLVALAGQKMGWWPFLAGEERLPLLVSLVFLALTAGLLVGDLDQPRRFLYVLLRPQWRSWLVRGAWILSGFGLALTWMLGRSYWRAGADPGLLGWGAAVLALLAAVYTAFLLAQARGRDFWQSPLSPVLMVVESLLAGSAMLLLLGERAPQLMGLLRGLLTLDLLLLLIDLWTPHATADARAAARMIWQGPYRAPFWGALLLGRLAPLLLILAAPFALALPALSGVVLLAILITEHLWIQAPQQLALS